MKNNVEIYMHLFAMLIIAFFTITMCMIMITIDISNIFKFFAVFVLVCCLYIFTNITTYFPHLGPALLAEDLSDENIENLSSISLDINQPDNTQIYYWNTKKGNFYTGNYEILTKGTTVVHNKKANLNYIDDKSIIYYRLIKPGQNIISSIYIHKL